MAQNDNGVAVELISVDPTLAVQMLLTQANYLKVEAELALTVCDARDRQPTGACRDLSPFGR
jgi:hypothetical protein